jgi:mRNA interferase MazF
VERLSRGGIDLARPDPAKGAAVGKLRPVTVFSAKEVVEVDSPLLFICPRYSRSAPVFDALHATFPPSQRAEGEESCPGGALPRHQPQPPLE